MRMHIKKALQWTSRNRAYILAAFTALALTPTAIQYAECERGHSGAVGGEFLLIPLAILFAHFIKTIPKELKKLWAEVSHEDEVQ